MVKRLWIVLILVCLAACDALDREVIVRADEMGVLVDTRQNQPAQVLHPGTYHLELSQRVYFYPTFTQLYRFSGEVANTLPGGALATGAPMLQITTLDSIQAQIGLDIVFHINPEAVFYIHEQWSSVPGDYRAGYIYHTVRIVARSVMSRYTAAQLYGVVYEELQRAISIPLQMEFAENGFILDRVMLTALQLPDDVRTQIESTLTPDGN